MGSMGRFGLQDGWDNGALFHCCQRIRQIRPFSSISRATSQNGSPFSGLQHRSSGCPSLHAGVSTHVDASQSNWKSLRRHISGHLARRYLQHNHQYLAPCLPAILVYRASSLSSCTRPSTWTSTCSSDMGGGKGPGGKHQA